MRLLVVLVLPALATACKSSTPCDMSSDTSLAKLVGLKGEPCVLRSTTFKGYARIGTHVDDLGCDIQHAVYRCRVDDPTAQARAMADAGWGAADPAGRARLAYAWLAEAVSGNGGIVHTDSPDFPVAGKAFAPPGFEPLETGGVRLRYWTETPHGMTPGSRYALRETVFNGDGLIISGRDVDRFETKE